MYTRNVNHDLVYPYPTGQDGATAKTDAGADAADEPIQLASSAGVVGRGFRLLWRSGSGYLPRIARRSVPLSPVLWGAIQNGTAKPWFSSSVGQFYRDGLNIYWKLNFEGNMDPTRVSAIARMIEAWAAQASKLGLPVMNWRIDPAAGSQWVFGRLQDARTLMFHRGLSPELRLVANDQIAMYQKAAASALTHVNMAGFEGRPFRGAFSISLNPDIHHLLFTPAGRFALSLVPVLPTGP